MAVITAVAASLLCVCATPVPFISVTFTIWLAVVGSRRAIALLRVLFVFPSVCHHIRLSRILFICRRESGEYLVPIVSQSLWEL